MERGGIKQFFDRTQTNHDPTSIIGTLVFWLVFIIVLTMATDALGIPQVSVVLGQLIAYIPSIIAAILILILAALLANFVSGIVRGTTGSNVLASVAQYAIIVYAAFAALTQLGIAVQLTANTFLILLGGVALADFCRGSEKAQVSSPAFARCLYSPYCRELRPSRKLKECQRGVGI
jgi:hypothetical protein